MEDLLLGQLATQQAAPHSAAAAWQMQADFPVQ
jgi:hypothetical protein